jgi:TRAP-type uncharacterized transport system fused permease subunit
MSLRAKIWLLLAFVFTCVNVFGVWYAAVHHELIHTAIHAGLLVLTAVLVGRFMPRRVPNY